MHLDDISCQYLIDCIRLTIKNPIAIIDIKGHILGCTHTEKIIYAEEIVKLCIQNDNYQEIASAYNTSFHCCYINEKLICYILLFDENTTFPNTVVYINTLINLILEQQQLKEQLESDFSERMFFINQLISTEEKNNEDLSSLAVQLKYNPNNIARCAILFEINHDKSDSRNFSDNIFEKYFLKALKNAKHFNTEDIYGLLNFDKFIIFKSIPSINFEESEKLIVEFTGDIYEEIQSNCGITIIAGAGSAYTELADLRKSYKESQFIISNFFHLAGNSSTVFVNHHIFEYLTSLLPPSYLENRFKNVSNTIKENAFILETLVALSKNNNNLVKSAAELGIHRNTMLQRLSKLKEALDVDPLHNDRDRLSIRQYALYQNRKTVLHAGVVIQEGSTLHAGYKKFAELIHIKSNGSMVLTIHTISITGDNKHLRDTLRSGSIDFALCAIDTLNEYTNNKVSVLDLPFLFDCAQQAYYILDGLIGKELFSELLPSGIIGLNYWSMGWRNITNRCIEIRTPKDIEGMKMRIMHNDMMESYYRQFGALPIKMNYGDVLKSLKWGLVDGQDNPYTNILGMKFYKYQKYITETKHCFDLVALLTIKSTWERLTKSQREIVLASATEATHWQREEMKKMNAISRQRLLDTKLINLISLSKEEKSEWLQSVQPIYQNYKHQDILSRIMEAKKDYNAKKIY
ncbi:DctP family TRAP transporter solute-binding subunit [Petroclostridium sp. X23]|uniref:DctP family TRAP transporter solute-binding subunit n=1 Tax=Petroclostridium sp. X23 TaxID=3045146 RepID=UPI0024AD02FA|nr:DctP family TRAP transporter solute-binding subunit [Petroclostridium sp. X23]WHH56808.1 DctP family TRAP transporter solute-binding subunit [Petroclostridium sp. X23]